MKKTTFSPFFHFSRKYGQSPFMLLLRSGSREVPRTGSEKPDGRSGRWRQTFLSSPQWAGGASACGWLPGCTHPGHCCSCSKVMDEAEFRGGSQSCAAQPLSGVPACFRGAGALGSAALGAGASSCWVQACGCIDARAPPLGAFPCICRGGQMPWLCGWGMCACNGLLCVAGPGGTSAGKGFQL